MPLGSKDRKSTDQGSEDSQQDLQTVAKRAKGDEQLRRTFLSRRPLPIVNGEARPEPKK
jgi:hypothetical protein